MTNSDFISILQNRFNENMHRHKNHKFSDIVLKLNDENIKILKNMEETGGEIDVVDLNNNVNEIIFIDCSKETPSGRRSLCYDQEALDKRKLNKPQDSAINLANKMNIKLLDEFEYRRLQEFEEFDLKTSSWILTPESIRNLGGALFCDRRYKKVFLYHNGADSYYSSRGFRAKIVL